MAFDVFLSLSEKDKPVGADLLNQLVTDGLKVWIYYEQIQPGDVISAKIREGIQQSRKLVFCLSAHAIESKAAVYELDVILSAAPGNEGRRAILLRLDDVKIPETLGCFWHIDWRPEVRNNAQEKKKNYDKLLGACRPPSGGIIVGTGKQAVENLPEPRPAQDAAERPQKRAIDVVCLGEALVDLAIYDYCWNDFLKKYANKDKSAPVYLSAGGSPFIVAQVIRKLGGTSEFIGKIGNDDFGKFLKGSGSKDFRHLTWCDDEKIRTRLVLPQILGGASHFEYITSPAADESLDAEDVNRLCSRVLNSCSILHFGGLVLKSPDLSAAASAAVETADAAKCIISFDVTYRARLWGGKDDDFEKGKVDFKLAVEKFGIFKRAHILKFTLKELRMFSSGRHVDLENLEPELVARRQIIEPAGAEDLQFRKKLEEVVTSALDDLVDKKLAPNNPNFTLAVVTCERYGCVWRTRDGLARYCPEHQIQEVIDPLGAGDSFIASLLLEILDRTDFRELPRDKNLKPDKEILKLPQEQWEEIFILANLEAAKSVQHHGPYLVIERNWAKNITYKAPKVEHPETPDQLDELVGKKTACKVLGTRHSFNEIADSETLISLDHFKVIKKADDSEQFEDEDACDPDPSYVTIGAGVRYGDLGEWLDKRDFALPNLASLPDISVAGACATATHGSGGVGPDKLRNLATSVVGFELLWWDGQEVQRKRFSRRSHRDTFDGMVVALGGLGVVTELTLKVVQKYELCQYVYENLQFDQLREHFDEIMGSAYSVSIFTDWQDKGINNQIWQKHRIDRGKPKPPFRDAPLAKKENRHPIGEPHFGKERAKDCTEQGDKPGPWHKRLPHFESGRTPSSGKELQSEYFVPLEKAADAIDAIRKWKDVVREDVLRDYLWISELRTIAADSLWMSPCFERESLSIHFTWKSDRPEGVKLLLRMIENELELAGCDPRPHWGKLFEMRPDRVKAKYTKLSAFQALFEKYDPKGKFRNKFLEDYIL
jgi:xylitol oxidase